MCVFMGDILSVLYGGVSGGSKIIYIYGFVVERVVCEVREWLLCVVSVEFEIGFEDFEIVDGVVCFVGVFGCVILF